MKLDEFAFFNQQLGTMLRDGIPLEGALQQLCANMQRGDLRAEIESLTTDLKNGVPINTALQSRRLPEFYVQMVRTGVQGNDLPGVLLLVADYYRRVDSIWARLKGLLVYPLMVLIGAFVISCVLTFFLTRLTGADSVTQQQLFEGAGRTPPGLKLGIWAPPIFIGLMLLFSTVVFLVPSINRHLRWKLSPFKEAKLAQVATAMQMLLKSGGNLNDSLGLLRHLEQDTAAGREMSLWQDRLADGRGKFSEMARPGKAFPPLFLWLVGNAGEDLAAGFQRAAEIYTARAVHQIEMFLYAALPFSIIALGLMIIGQIAPALRVFLETYSLFNGLS